MFNIANRKHSHIRIADRYTVQWDMVHNHDHVEGIKLFNAR